MLYSPDKAQPITRRAEERVLSAPVGTSIFGDPVFASDQVAMKLPSAWQTRGAPPAYAGLGWFGDTPAAPPWGLYLGIGVVALGLAGLAFGKLSFRRA